MKINWRHAKEDDTHVVDPCYSAIGKWVCRSCRNPINDNGRTVNMNAIKDDTTTDPNSIGLQNEGS